MTQYINLITRHRARKSMAMFVMIGLGGLIFSLFIWGVISEIRLHQMANATQEVEQQVAELRSELLKKRHEAGLDDAQVLAKESAQMRSSMETYGPLMQLVQKGEVGNMQGHSVVLQTLATTPQTGVWLQGVDVMKAGQIIRITGMAQTTTAVMQYAGQLNQSFKPMGVAFSSLEISKEDVPASALLPKSTVIKFNLY